MLIPVSVLKASLSKILARARSGEIIEVTSHAKSIARIMGIPAASSPTLGALATDGSVTWNGKKPSFATHLPELSKRGKSLCKIIRENRT